MQGWSGTCYVLALHARVAHSDLIHICVWYGYAIFSQMHRFYLNFRYIDISLLVDPVSLNLLGARAKFRVYTHFVWNILDFYLILRLIFHHPQLEPEPQLRRCSPPTPPVDPFFKKG